MFIFSYISIAKSTELYWMLNYKFEKQYLYNLCYISIKFTNNAVAYTHLNYNYISITLQSYNITNISRSIQMSENCSICSFLLGLNTVTNLSHIKAHCYITITSVCAVFIEGQTDVWLLARFSGIIAGLTSLVHPTDITIH